jgi:chaperonin GroEL
VGFNRRFSGVVARNKVFASSSAAHVALSCGCGLPTAPRALGLGPKRDRLGSPCGVALLHAVEALKRLRTENEDQKHGVEIVRKALQTPARQIAINAGDDGSVVVGKILEKDQYNFGYDAQTGEYGNLVSKGIIDPTKVVRTALQDAASVAGLLITTEAMVAEVPKKEPAAPAMPGGGMGGMDY